MAKETFILTADDKDFQSAAHRLQRELNKMEESFRKLTQQSKLAGKENKEAFGSQDQMISGVVTKLASAAAAYLSISSAIRLMNAELERTKQLQRETSQVQLGTAAAERELIINAGAITGTQRDQLLGGVSGVASRRNISRADALRGAAAGIGFTGQVQPTLAALDVAAQINPHDVAALTPGLLATRGVTGSQDPKANLGFLLGVQQFSPIKSTSLLSENLIPAAAGVRLQGDTDIEAASLVNALSTALVDPTGQQSGTAAQRLSAVLAKQLPGMGSTRERIEFLQKNPQAAKRAGAGIEQGATKAALVSLITDPNSQAAKAFRESLSGIPAAGARVGIAEAAIANAGGTPVQELSSLDRTIAAASEGLQFANQGGAMGGSLQERIGQLEDAAGLSYLQKKSAGMIENFGLLTGRDPLETAFVRATGARNVAQSGGRTEAVAILNALLEEMRGMRAEQLRREDADRTLRQNAPNDLDTHTEGR